MTEVYTTSLEGFAQLREDGKNVLENNYTHPMNLGQCIFFSSPQAVASLSRSCNVRINASKSSNMASTA